MNIYDSSFFENLNAGAVYAATQMLPLLADGIDIRSVLDVGCGQGAWLSVWRDMDVVDAIGVDGAYVERERLLIPPGDFREHDLSASLDLQRRFDLVQSLEVAEHLPAACAEPYVDSLVRHGDLVLFAAAPKGQGGLGHVNERPYAYWRAQFARHGYVPIDCIRPKVLQDPRIPPWYRYNTLLYVAGNRLAQLPDGIRANCLADHEPIADVSPFLYRLRKGLVRFMPVPMMDMVAKAKESWRNRRRGKLSSGRAET